MYAAVSLTTSPHTLQTNPDPLPHRPNPNNRPTKNPRLLRAAAKAKRHGGLRGRDSAHFVPVAAGRVSGRAVRDFCAVWGFLCDDWGGGRECACGGAVYSERVGGVVGGEEEC